MSKKLLLKKNKIITLAQYYFWFLVYADRHPMMFSTLINLSALIGMTGDCTDLEIHSFGWDVLFCTVVLCWYDWLRLEDNLRSFISYFSKFKIALYISRVTIGLLLNSLTFDMIYLFFFKKKNWDNEVKKNSKFEENLCKGNSSIYLG